MMRYGLIGSGMMGQEHIRNVALLDGAEIAAIADPDQRMLGCAAELAGARAYPDHRAMLDAEALDALIVAAPNDLHHALMCDALAYGRPILCEKPLASTAADALDLARRAAAGPPVWVAMEYRFMPPVARLVEAVQAGRAGAPRMVAIREHRFPFLEKIGDWNRFNARTGGTMVEKCCHFWDLMRLILQADPVRVYASAAADVNHRDERYAGRVPDILDNGFVVVDFAGGARAMLDLCMFAEGSHWQEVISVTGPAARIEARVPGPARFSPDGAERHAELAIADRAARRETAEIIETDEAILRAGDHHGATFFQHQRFLQMLRDGGQPEVTLADGAWAVRVGAAAEESAQLGQPVDLAAAAVPA
ncbi:MAG: Gfo/Idh/MocA family oxidoreductase [Pseudomonadota bacterium]